MNLDFESDFSKINKLDWNTLSCLDKAFALAVSIFHRNAFWNFVFRKYSESDYLMRCIPLDYADKTYYNNVGRYAGIEIRYHSVARKMSYESIRDALNSGELCVIIINNKYRPGSKHFEVKDHPHFILITKLDDDIFSVIDEPVEKELWKPENYKNGVAYSKQSINAYTLFSMTYDVDKFAQCLGFQVKDSEDLYYFSIAPLKSVPSNTHIHAILKSEIAIMVESSEPHINFIAKELVRFCKLYLERYQKYNLSDTIDMKELHKSDPLGIKEKTYFPYEWKLVKFHMAYFKAITQCVTDLVGTTGNTGLYIESIHLDYSKLQMLLSRDIIKNNYSEFPYLVDKFYKIYQAEMSVLRGFLSIL